MRVFKVSDGTSWVARVHDPAEHEGAAAKTGWEAVVFESKPSDVAQLVYRPNGWLEGATMEELVAALREGVAIRVRWGG
jgi:hypothetical protein